MSLKKGDRASHWILLRGLAREARHWGTFPSELETALNSASSAKPSRVDAIDLPGAGKYSEMKSPISMPDIAEFVREKFLEIRRRIPESGGEPPAEVCLVAISLGGMVACEWLTQWPGDLSACILINTSFKGYSPVHKRLLPGTLKNFSEIFTARTSLTREKAILRMISNRANVISETARPWARMMDTRPFSYENFSRQLLAAARFQPRLEGVPPVPVLVIGSHGDRMVDPSCSRQIAERWNVELRMHENGGHDLPLDEPAWVIDEMVKWWRT